MEHTSWIELSRAALGANLEFMRRRVGPEPRYSAVVKANAYGHGIEELVPVLVTEGVDHFSVFSVAEARRVRAVAPDECEVMIMGWIDDDRLDWAIAHDISFFVFTPERLAAAVGRAREVGRPARIHVELETGMHRTGFTADQVDGVVETLERHPDELQLDGLCTHFAGAENSASYERVQRQVESFEEQIAALADRGVRPLYRHAACTAGALRFPRSILDLVRIGIANYGFWPSHEIRREILSGLDSPSDPLQRVLTWKSRIMSVNRVPANEYVSYGTSYLTNRESRIATVPVGYGYGFSRTLSNSGHVLTGGRRVPVVGVVNMNMLVIDVTDVGDPEVGDEVVLIGDQGSLRITVSSFSDMNDSLNYELLTRLPGHIPRQVVD